MRRVDGRLVVGENWDEDADRGLGIQWLCGRHVGRAFWGARLEERKGRVFGGQWLGCIRTGGLVFRLGLIEQRW